MKKTLVRKCVREMLRALSPEDISSKSLQISKQLFRTTWWDEAETILAFCSMKKEIDTDEIMKTAFRESKTVGVPRVAGENLIFHHIRNLDEDFTVGVWGIREPASFLPELDPITLPSQNVLIVTPGLAFDSNKNRLGRGKGFYDRFLQRIRSCRHLTISAIGVCFFEQILDHVPVGDHDQTVDGVITEKEILY